MSKPQAKLGTEKINRLLIKLSTPAMLAMFATALYNIVDTIFIGHGVGSMGIAAVAIVLPIVGIISSFAHMVGIGSASLLSRSLGAKKYSMVDNIAGNSMLMIFLIGVFFTTVGLIFNEPVLRLFGATDKIIPYASAYSQIIFIAMLWFPFCVSSNNLLRAEGNAKEAMNAMLLGMIVNTGLDYVFIFPLNMGMEGAALATALGKFANLIYIIYYFNSSKTIITLKPKNFRLKKYIVKETTGVGLSGLGMRSSGSIAVVILNHTLGSLGGEIAIAIFAIIYRVSLFIALPLFGLNQGMQPIVGYNYGAEQPERVKKTIRIGLGYSLFFGLFIVGIAEIFPREIYSIFTNDPELISRGTGAFRIVVSMMWVMGISIAGTGIHQALGMKKSSFLLSIMRWIILVVPLVLLLPNLFGLGITGVWLAFPLADLAAALITISILVHTLYVHEIISSKMLFKKRGKTKFVKKAS
ncbi:MAG: MATE family efflux transporter [Bacteroidales bacterium]|nr:MATE family efflux transporter [Bacteroidales bacterium]MCF8336725.1 MATE family efflux transporter [Bacteroidales bacterium]